MFSSQPLLWCVLHSFFFFEFRRISAVSADTDQFGPNRRELGNRRKKKKTLHEAQATASLAHRRIGRRCSGHFATSVHPSVKVPHKVTLFVWPAALGKIIR